MTRPLQKRQERIFVEEAARLLDRSWDIGNDREHPDFIVSERGQQFGLEVTQIFIGRQDDTGSSLKAAESKIQRALSALQREYEAIENVSLVVKFVGNMEVSNLATVVPALLAQDLRTKPVCYHFVHDTTVANPARARLRVHVTKALHPDWYSVNDRVGFVSLNPLGIIADAIMKKADQLPRYKQIAGIDVRLLLVANRISNSGKLMLDKGAQFDLRGFNTVYLFPYPEDVIILESASGSTPSP
ncbi:MAG: hypothetical protein K2X57_19805 [Xanthobacteraceae bacterium]|nr:hypothetical protein [Xanthobacteraceae bacterium]